MFILNKKSLNMDQNGFTIVELIISTSIFAIVLTAVTLGVTNLSKIYSRTVITSSTQNTVQNITNNIEELIKTSDGNFTFSVPPYPVTSVPGVLCVGNIQFNYRLALEQPDQISPYNSIDPYALYEEPLPGGVCNTAAPTYVSGGQSLLSDNERLLAFNVQSITGPADIISITIKVAYTAGGTNGNGNSLLCLTTVGSSAPGGCNASAMNISNSQLINNSSNIICKQGQGKQFCDVAGLQTNVENRL